MYKIWILYTRGCFVSNKVEIGTVVQEEKIFKISSIYHRYFINVSPWNFHYSRMLCAKFGWNRPSSSLKTIVNEFSAIPLKNDGVLCLNKLESPLHNDYLCQVWLKFAHWFLRKRQKCEKLTTATMTTTTDNRQTSNRKLTCTFGSGELKKKKKIYHHC